MNAATATARAKALPSKPPAIRWDSHRVGEPREFHVAEQLHGRLLPDCWARIDRDEDGEYIAIIWLGHGFVKKQLAAFGGYQDVRGAKKFVRDKVGQWLAAIAKIRFRKVDVDETAEGERLYQAGLTMLLTASSANGEASIFCWRSETHFILEFNDAGYELPTQKFRFVELAAAKTAARILLGAGRLAADEFMPWPGDLR